MVENSKMELVFIPSPGRGHLNATMEVAKLLIDRDERLSVTMLVIDSFFNDKSGTEDPSHLDQQSLGPDHDSRIRVIDLPRVEPLFTLNNRPPVTFHGLYIEGHKGQVRNAVEKLVGKGSSGRLVGFVIDMFCTSMIDVANEFNVPTYLFYTSGAAVLGLLFHFQSLRDDENQDILAMCENSGVEVLIPSYKNPIPANIMPMTAFTKDGDRDLLHHAKRYRETKGIMINTFLELESIAMKSLHNDENIPPVYSIGPILHVDGANDQNPRYDEIMKWLDEQPNSSVVFLCFGSKGCFNINQVKEIAFALERSGHRFLWSLRKPPVEHEFGNLTEYENLEEVLPEGFLQRTSGIGKVIGWAPQVAVLGHPAVGGFVSHCGWNSTLESISCGVPIAAWPIYAEQHLNAFELVKDLGLAVEIKMDYKRSMLVTADEIENEIRSLMDPNSEMRINVEAMKVKSRMTLEKGGSSFGYMDRFIENLCNH